MARRLERIRLAGIVVLLVLFCFVFSDWAFQPKLQREALDLLLFGIGVLGALSLYFFARQARTEFLLRRELQDQLMLDTLTRIMNRRAFTTHLETAWLQAQRNLTSIGLILVDLDQFKQINEICGQPFADNALQRVGQVLQGLALRPLDGAGRYGGDEFMAVWYDVDGNWLGRLAQEIPTRLHGLQCGTPGAPVPVTVSGAAILAWPRPGISVQDAVRAAHRLLDETQRTRRGTVTFEVLRPAGAAQERSAA